MRWFWLLLFLPSLCLARIVQIDDLVKKDKGYPPGVVIHEVAGHVVQPGEIWSQGQYKLAPVYRYQFGGVVKEGRKHYIKLVVHNLFLEDVVSRNRQARHHSKAGSPGRALAKRSTTISLLVLTEKGRATFAFPEHVVTASREEALEVKEAVLELDGSRLEVIETTDRIFPVAKLAWTPPRDWPSESQTVYVEPAAKNRETSANQ